MAWYRIWLLSAIPCDRRASLSPVWGSLRKLSTSRTNQEQGGGTGNAYRPGDCCEFSAAWRRRCGHFRNRGVLSIGGRCPVARSKNRCHVPAGASECMPGSPATELYPPLRRIQSKASQKIVTRPAPQDSASISQSASRSDAANAVGEQQTRQKWANSWRDPGGNGN